jgi:hypothetical protein
MGKIKTVKNCGKSEKKLRKRVKNAKKHVFYIAIIQDLGLKFRNEKNWACKLWGFVCV